jgi:hypothetical protein
MKTNLGTNLDIGRRDFVDTQLSQHHDSRNHFGTWLIK